MPHRNVLDVWVSASNFGDDVLQPIRESLGLCFEVSPPMLELTLALVIDILPIIIDDKTRDLNVVLGQLIYRIEDLLVGESLAESVPCTFDM